MIGSFLESTLPATTQRRLSYGMAGISPDAVTQSSDEAICTRGSALVDSLTGLSNTGNPVYAYAVGGGHYVINPARAVYSELEAAFVFDTAWTFRGHVAVPGSRDP